MTKYYSTVTIPKQLPIHHRAFQMVLHLYRSQVGDITCSPPQNWWWKQTDLSYLHLPNQFNFTGCGLVTYWLFALMASTVLNARNSSLHPGLHNVSFHNECFFITHLFNGKNYDGVLVFFNSIFMIILSFFVLYFKVLHIIILRSWTIAIFSGKGLYLIGRA